MPTQFEWSLQSLDIMTKGIGGIQHPSVTRDINIIREEYIALRAEISALKEKNDALNKNKD